MGAGEFCLGEEDAGWGLPEHLVDDSALECPATGRPCPVKVLLRSDHEAGDISTPGAREEAAVQLGIALSLHEEAFTGSAQNCQPDQPCPVPSEPFMMEPPRTLFGGVAAAFQE